MQRTQNESNQNGSISESLCSGTAGISSSEVPVEIHGLRRRRNCREKTTKSLSLLHQAMLTLLQQTILKLREVHLRMLQLYSSPSIVYYGIIESVDSISRDGPDCPYM